MLSRVARIQAQLIQSWDVLGTMTPADYMRFRDSLGQSSGFQSWQYRVLEFLLGNKEARLIEVHARRQARRMRCCSQELSTPSLYDEAIRLLARRGFDIPTECVERDWTQPYEANPAVEAAWLAVYRDSTGALGPVRTGREARGPRVQAPAVALRAHEDGRAHHRLQARHRRLEPASAISRTC